MADSTISFNAYATGITEVSFSIPPSAHSLNRAFRPQCRVLSLSLHPCPPVTEWSRDILPPRGAHLWSLYLRLSAP
jgi:hypothetical protein